MRSIPLCLVLIALVFTTAGCGFTRTADERNALYAQNQELQAELDRARMALDQNQGDPAAAARVAELEAELARQRSMQQQQPTRLPPPPMPAADTGAEAFEGIEGVQPEMRGGDIELRLASDILFAPGSATLSPTARRSLAEVARVIQSKYGSNQLIVEGHTDTDPIKKSKWESNQALSVARAEAVADLLAERGVSRSRLETVGYGSERARETKSQSRRVEIVVMQ